MSKNPLTKDEIKEGFKLLGLVDKYSEPYTNGVQFSKNLMKSFEYTQSNQLMANSQSSVEEEQDA